MKLKDTYKVLPKLLNGDIYYITNGDFHKEYSTTFIRIPALKVNIHYYSSYLDVEYLDELLDERCGYAFFDMDTNQCLYSSINIHILETPTSNFLSEIKHINWTMEEIRALDCELVEDIAVFDNYIIEEKI
ncbi:hypothetical protein [Evtepia gabavorous]|uniref:hypothetical protein n=1 Tax=Evtepia gabavorous TaxID=2211183 RepID=UPI003999C8A0